MNYETLLKLFQEHNKDFEKQKDAGIRSLKTYCKYCTTYRCLQDFLKYRYRVNDIALKELTPSFISHFDMHLRTERGCCTNSIILYTLPLRRMICIAIDNGMLTRNPFANYKPFWRMEHFCCKAVLRYSIFSICRARNMKSTP